MAIRAFGYLSIMKAVIQRVSKASVKIDEQKPRAISKGLVILLGVGQKDSLEDVIILGKKILNLRIFQKNNKMDLSIQDIKGSLLIVSQFTLYADCTRGNRPSFINAAKPVHAKKIYTEFVNYMRNQSIMVQTGVFGEQMAVSLINDGPVTLIMNTNQ